MSTTAFACLALCIGIVAGLRALTAPMAIAWAARVGWIDVRHTWAAFLAHPVTPWIFTALAIGELVNDQNPKAPARTAPPSFVFRLVSGGFCGAALAASGGRSLVVGIFLGALGAAIGTLGGYHARVRLVRALHVPDSAIALPEDLIAVGGAFLIAAFFRAAVIR
ncbi:MAG TPA: DUF4126 domain-containing protein [Polyangia bacterium]|nr:DUF4126 domain-containing protein [Polyangia bacterium]